MEKMNGWENAKSFGDFKTLVAGGYKCVVKEVVAQKSSNGKDFIKISYDIADGEFKDFFKDKYINDNRQDKKWGGVWCLFLQGYEPNSINSKFKGFITSIEESNNGYKWNWDETTLKDKKVGIVLREEEFIATDGSTKSAAKPFYATSYDKAENEKIPIIKTIVNNNINTDINNDFGTFSSDDLPF